MSKIEAQINYDKIVEYAKTHKEFVVKGKEENAYGGFNLYENDVTKYGNDCSICIKKAKDSTEKTFFIGNGRSENYQAKRNFEQKLTEERKHGRVIKNPFESSSISLSINLTALRKYLEAHPKSKNEKGYVDILILISHQCNEWGNDVSIAIQKPENSSEETCFIGSGKTQAAFDEMKQRKANAPIAEPVNDSLPKDQMNEVPVQIDDLPF